jgi:hypothetical protein
MADDELTKTIDGIDEPHVTLVFLGNVETLNKAEILDAVSTFAASHAPISGKFSGFGIFNANPENDNKTPVVILLDSPNLSAFRQVLLHSIPNVMEQNHGFTAHMTLTYTDNEQVIIPKNNAEYSKTFDSISLFWGGEHIKFPLVGTIVEKQLPINEQSRANLITIRTDIFNNDSDALAEQMFTGGISLGQWEEQMKTMVKELHTSTATIGKGGWENMTQSDWGRAGAEIRAQYRYLHGFAEKVATDSDTMSLKAIQARAHMYGNASKYTAVLMQAGDLSGGTKRHPTGFDKLPFLPGDGSSECITNCKCQWVLTVVDKTKTVQLIQAVWVLGDAEHCKTCIERDDYTVILKVPIDIDIPDIIGGY